MACVSLALARLGLHREVEPLAARAIKVMEVDADPAQRLEILRLAIEAAAGQWKACNAGRLRKSAGNGGVGEAQATSLSPGG